ncbi:hypothetical protein ACIZ1P_01120 [Pseudomonas guariconensis]|uniref:hypothetical protein n=1 Tax=Pseudomonas guariconensis TaxID=1288410 RepID=UPI003F68DACA
MGHGQPFDLRSFFGFVFVFWWRLRSRLAEQQGPMRVEPVVNRAVSPVQLRVLLIEISIGLQMTLEQTTFRQDIILFWNDCVFFDLS